MTQLLVSVRSAAEAAAALAGGACLIDVKEPARGALGRASDWVLGEILQTVSGRAPVSVALGELSSDRDFPLPAAGSLAFAKWGLAGLHPAGGGSVDSARRFSPVAPNSQWSAFLDRAASRLHMVLPDCRLVTVAYADYQRAGSPPPAEALAYALDRRRGPFLLDTFVKDGSTLLDHLGLAAIIRSCCLCRDAGVPIALAGSLGPREMRRLRAAEPTWFAVRGAACRDRSRLATIDPARVRRLADLLTLQAKPA